MTETKKHVVVRGNYMTEVVSRPGIVTVKMFENDGGGDYEPEEFPAAFIHLNQESLADLLLGLLMAKDDAWPEEPG